MGETRKPEFRRCRCLTVAGRQCLKNALAGEKFCHEHKQHRRPVCPQKDSVEMPLLEDLSAIQLVTSQVSQGLFADTIDPRRAGKILYACQVAAMTMARPSTVKTEPANDYDPVTEVFKDDNGELLGPEVPWVGVDGCFEPIWSRDKMLYERECERLGKLKPQGPADMPPEGWLTPEEQAEDEWTSPNRWKMKILERRIEEDKHYKLPPLEERACYYDNPHCCGPIKKSPSHVVCEYCAWEREAHERILCREKDAMPPGARERCARAGVRLTAFPDPAAGNETASDAGRPGLRGPAGAHDLKRGDRAGDSGADDWVDEPEETEVLDPQLRVFLDMRKSADDVGTLPPLEERTCDYSMPDCAGPASASPCTYCRRERDYYRKLHKGDGGLNLRGCTAVGCCTGGAALRAAAPLRQREEGPASKERADVAADEVQNVVHVFPPNRLVESPQMHRLEDTNDHVDCLIVPPIQALRTRPCTFFVIRRTGRSMRACHSRRSRKRSANSKSASIRRVIWIARSRPSRRTRFHPGVSTSR